MLLTSVATLLALPGCQPSSRSPISWPRSARSRRSRRPPHAMQPQALEPESVVTTSAAAGCHEAKIKLNDREVEEKPNVAGCQTKMILGAACDLGVYPTCAHLGAGGAC